MRDDYIKNKCSLDLEEWPPNQPKTVVNVALIHYKGSRTEQELIEISKRHKEGAPAVDKLAHHSRVTKDISIIFQTHVINSAESETKPPKLILIEGAPGIGKTVLARRIAYLWAKEELLANLNILFLLFLRDPELQSIKTAEELIQYLSKNDLHKEEVKNCVQQIKNLQVAIVMDGFDEYPIQLRKRSFIADIIKGRVFHNCTIVLTSRPTATIKLHSQADRRVEILGFAQEERDKYICESLDSPEQRKQIQDFLKCQPIINGLVYVPLHLAVLLYLFKVQSKLPETLTEMNELFILHTIYRSLTKDEIITEDEVTAINCIENLPKNILGIVKGLSKLAFMGLENDRLVFSWDDITESCPQIKNNIPGAFNGFGLLQAVQHFPKAGQPGTTVSFNFLHFTMQEFLAALHVSDTSVIPYEQQLSLMEDKFWNSMFNFMWMMYVGINGVNSKAFMEFLYKVQPGTNIKQLELSNDIKSDKRKCLHLFQCFMETKSKEIPKEISNMFCNNEMNFHGLQLLPHHISSLTLYLSKYSMQLETLNLRDCHIGDVGMSILEHYFTTNPNKALTIKHIDLFGNDSLLLQNVYCAIFSQQNLIKLNWSSLGKVNIEEILAVMNNNVAVQSLNLSDNDFNDDDAERIAGVLVNNNTLKELNFSRNKITTKGAVAISDCVQKNVKLQHLIISWNNHSINTDHQTIDFSRRSANDTDVQIVTNILCKNETVTKLDLSHNKISDKGAKSICMCIESNKSLKEIDISGNKFSTAGLEKILDAVQINLTIQKFSISHYKISDDRVLAISEYLKNNSTLQELNISHIKISSGMISKTLQMNTALQIFDISHYNITAEGAIAISECLKNNNTLQKLYISYNQVSDNSIIIISKALQTNTMLQVLVISHNKITDEGAAAISECLKNNNTLQEFDISYNEVSDNGIAKISKALQINTTLQILLISHNNISDDRVVAVGKTLQSHYKDYSIVTTNKEIINEDHIKNSALQKLNMSCNKISSIGIVALCNYLKCNVTLQELKISWDDCKTPIVLDSTSKVCNMSNLYFRDVGATLVSAFLFTKVETQILNVSHNAISDDGAVAISEYLNNNNTLQLLNMSHNQVSGIGAINISKALQKNSSLQVLVISHNIISDDGAIAIGKILRNNYKDSSMVNEDSIQNSTLQKLDMSHNNISSKGIVALSDYFKSNVTLQKLAISWVDYKTPIVLDGTRKICSMSNLNFRDVGATLISAFLFKKVETRILDISHNAISDDGAVAISEYLNNNNTLQHLDMSHNLVSVIGAIHISKALQINSSLQVLVISHNIISDDGAIGIGKILRNNHKDSSVVNEDSIQNSTLQKLNMSHNNISSKGIVALCDYLKSNVTLQELIISWDNCTCKTPIVLDGTSNMSNLDFEDVGATLLAAFLLKKEETQKLDISHNAISDDGAVAISEYLRHNRTLLELNISHNEITSEAIAEILKSIHSDSPLHTLNLTHNIVTKSGFKIIHDIYKKCSNMPSMQISYNEIIDNYQNVDTILVSFENDCKEKFTTTNVKLEMYNRRASYKVKVLFFYAIEDDFVKKLDLSSHGITNTEAKIIAKALHCNKSLQKLDISSNNISDDGAIAIGKILRNNYKDSSVVNEDSIQNSTLQKLNISHNNISSKGIVALCDYLKNNVTLQELTISWDDCKTPIVLDSTSKVCNMSNLYFGDVGATLVSAFLFKKVETRILDISHNTISDDGAVAISEYLNNNNTLRLLNMSHNQVSGIGAINISKALQKNSSLQVLVISHNIISDDRAIAIGKILRNNYKDSSMVNEDSIQNSTLQKLDMSHNNLSSKGIVALSDYFKSNVTLQKLAISWVDYKTPIVLDGTRKICSMSNLIFRDVGATLISAFLFKKVETRILDISHNAISDDGAVAISEYLNNNNTLRLLNMSHNQVSGIGAINISKALQKNSSLQVLVISHNIISDDGAIAIGKILRNNYKDSSMVNEDSIQNSTLQKLDMSHNNLSSKGIVALSDYFKSNVTLQKLAISWVDCKTTIVLDGTRKICSMSNLNFRDVGATLISAFLFKKVETRILDISHNAISDDGAVAISEYLNNNNTLQHLDMSHNLVSVIGAIHISKALQINSALQVLVISHNIISDDGAIGIGKILRNNHKDSSVVNEDSIHNSTLQKLNMSHNNISSKGIVALCDYLKNNVTLQELTISWDDCKIPIVLEGTSKICNMSNLCFEDVGATLISAFLFKKVETQILDISHNAISDDGAVAISEYLNNNNTLQQLDMSHNQVSGIGIISITKALQTNITIQLLDVSYNNISDDGAIVIGETLVKIENPKLRKLNLSYNNISIKGIVALSDCFKRKNTLQELIVSWRNCKGLLILNINNINKFSGMHFGDPGAILVSAFLLQKKDIIQILDLSINTISDDGAVAISEYLKYNGMLQELNLSHNEITSEGTTEILNSIHSDSPLHSLNLTHNIVTKSGLMMIYNIYKKCNNMPSVEISYNEIVGISKDLHTTLVYFEYDSKKKFNQLTASKVMFDRQNERACYKLKVLCYCAREDNLFKNLDMSKHYVTNEGVKIIAKTLQGTSLQKLDISHNAISDDGAVAISEYLNNNTLQHLNISHNLISVIGAFHISKALQINSSLQVLVISHNNISDDGAIAIGKILRNNKDSSTVNKDGIQNSTLQKLNMSHNNISSKGIADLCNYLKSNITLQELIISWDDCKTPIVFNGTSNMSNLYFGDVGVTLVSAFVLKKEDTQKLDISYNAISDDGAVAISEYFKYNGMLQELNMSHNEITSEGIVEILKSICSDSPLHILNLTHNIVTKPGLMMIYDIYKKCTNVPSMQISYNEIADNSQKIDTFLVSFENNHKKSFDQLKTTKVDFNGSASYRAQVLCFCATENKFIKELDISRHGITNKVTKTIAKALQGNVSLQKLDISNNKISDDGTVAISEWFKNNNTLQKLDISYNQVFNIGINEIAKALQIQRTLQMLNISHNNISDDGVIAISECLKANTTIKELDISNNKITNDGITKIAEAIKANTTLSLLDVSKNNMDRSTKVATVFSDHLKHNNILRVLGISWNGSDTTYVYHVGINNECYVDTSWPKFKRSLVSVNWDRYYYKPEFNYIEAILLIALVYGNIDLKIIKIVGKKISDSAAFIFSDFLKVNNTIETLKLSDSTIYTEAIKQTIRAFQANTTLQMLDISSNNISDDVVVAISECLKANTTLQELDISNNKITNDGIIKIAEAIAANTTLSLLDVSENNMDRSTEVARALSGHLKHNNTLQVLKISWNYLYSDTTYVYHVGMNNECYVDITRVKSYRHILFASWNVYHRTTEFNDIEAILLTALAYGHVDVKVIRIVNNKIFNSAALVISDFLKANKTIETLKLSNNTISTEATKKIIKAIQTNTTLLILDISSNNIHDDGVIAISECLKANTTLKELDISNNKITNDGIIKIAEAIKANTTLSLLDVSKNNMDRSTKVATVFSDHLKHNNILNVLRISWNDSDTTYVYHVGVNNECYVDTSWPKFKRSLASVNWNRYYYDELAFNNIEAILLIALVCGNVDVKTIKIVNNKISNSAALVISDFLKANKTIETLKLSNNTISTEATKKIIKAIQTNTTLQILDISSTYVSDDVAVTISECLTNNNTLRELSLSCNPTTTKRITKIAEAIAVNTGLHTLDLSSQYIKHNSAMLLLPFYLPTSKSILIDNDDLVMILLNIMDHNYTMMRLVVPMTVKKNEAVRKRKLDQINKERTKRSIKPLKLQNAAAN